VVSPAFPAPNFPGFLSECPTPPLTTGNELVRIARVRRPCSLVSDRRPSSSAYIGSGEHRHRGSEVRKLRPILELPNHAKVRRVLHGFCSPGALQFLDDAVTEQAACWFRLGVKHLRVARKLDLKARDEWRSVGSRAYYAAYSASKAIRYLTTGDTLTDAADHKRVGDLPDDFPNKNGWAVFLNDLRDARNRCDYDPWPDTKSALPLPVHELSAQAAKFVREARAYLKQRGVKL